MQYAGDYAEAYRRLSAGGPETYYAQRYSIDVVAALVGPSAAVATVCCSADRDEDCELGNGVRSINLRAPGGVDEGRVWKAVASCAPTHVCLRTPLHRVLRRAIKEDTVQSILLTLADSFSSDGLRGRLRAWRLRRLFHHSKVIAVGNHGRSSSESLRRIGVDAGKIVPWDWPHAVTPHQWPAKEARRAAEWRILFVGILSESKGLGDVMRAVRALKDRGTIVRLSYAGRGDANTYAELAKELQIEDQVTALGLISHAAVVPAMREADLVVVASHHDYPEGFPMTIYEALSSRTPIIASDHPMYADHLRTTGAALVFPAGDHGALADAIQQVAADPRLYRSLSRASAPSWEALQLPVTWGELVSAWAANEPGRPFEPLKHALTSRV